MEHVEIADRHVFGQKTLLQKAKPDKGEQISKFTTARIFSENTNSMKVVILLHSFYWSIHTKDESKCRTAFDLIFGVN